MQGKERSPAIPYFFLILGILFSAVGIFYGEAGKIYDKAIMICLQCIGIG